MSEEHSLFFRLMQYGTVGFGFVCFTIPLLLGVKFIKSRKPIGKAIAIMLFGECIGIAVTILFAILNDGVMDDYVGPIEALALRLTMFAAAIVTSLHLAYQMWIIEIE